MPICEPPPTRPSKGCRAAVRLTGSGLNRLTCPTSPPLGVPRDWRDYHDDYEPQDTVRGLIFDADTQGTVRHLPS